MPPTSDLLCKGMINYSMPGCLVLVMMLETAEEGTVSDISAPEVVSIDTNPESILPCDSG